MGKMGKIEDDKMNWHQKEIEVSGQREAERIKELKELWENKANDKDAEIQRLRENKEKVEKEQVLLNH